MEYDRLKQYYGIKYPFTNNNHEGFFIDLNGNIDEKVASYLLHTILTPKGSRLRKPDFGTNLAKYIFEQNDEMTWDIIRSEINDAVSKHVKNVKINDINIIRSKENDNEIYLELKYEVQKGYKSENNRLVVKM